MSLRVEHIGDATLYLGDCREVLPTLGKVDAAIVSDPPYGMNYLHGAGGRGIWATRHETAIIGDDVEFDPSHLLDFEDAILWGANHFAHRLPKSAGWLVWDKKLGLKEDNFSDGEAAWHKCGTRLFINRHLWNGLLAREVGERRIHPAQKPIALMSWCISKTKAGTIIDPYCGSGTTGVAALSLGRRFIGIEIEPAYFDIACKRIEAEHRRPRIPGLDQPRPKQVDIFAGAA